MWILWVNLRFKDEFVGVLSCCFFNMIKRFEDGFENGLVDGFENRLSESRQKNQQIKH